MSVGLVALSVVDVAGIYRASSVIPGETYAAPRMVVFLLFVAILPSYKFVFHAVLLFAITGAHVVLITLSDTIEVGRLVVAVLLCVCLVFYPGGRGRGVSRRFGRCRLILLTQPMTLCCFHTFQRPLACICLFLFCFFLGLSFARTHAHAHTHTRSSAAANGALHRGDGRLWGHHVLPRRPRRKT